MAKILGLDLGSASIGWAMVNETESNGNTSREIVGLGCRIIPYEGTEGKDFEKGTGESKNSVRTQKRTARKGYDRYQLRREQLAKELHRHSMLPSEELQKLPKMQLWELRSRAATEKVSLLELGRIMLWLNQKRGYKSGRGDSDIDKKDPEYVAKVKNRHQHIRELNATIGQYFYRQLKENEFFRVKENIFPREAYIEEFDTICKEQQKHHPETLKDELILKIRNEIVYYQRPLKSQKGLVSVCEFEGFLKKSADGKECFVGPKVAPKSSPVFQHAKLWESINNIRIEDKYGNGVEITPEQKQALFNHLNSNEKLTQKDIEAILGLKKRGGYSFNKQIAKGIQGNTTRHAIVSCFDDAEKYAPLLKFDLAMVETDRRDFLYNKSSGEVIGEKALKYVDPKIESEPLYRLWHTIYSISDKDECCSVLQGKFGIEKDVAEKLASIDFTKQGFGNKSVRAIRKILPYLTEGDGYSEAMCYAGYNHSGSLTKDENRARELQDRLKPIAKNSLRQPVVEKILNQTVRVVNAIIDKYGKPDEIRIELARELKQSKAERNETFSRMGQLEKENLQHAKELEKFGLRATRNNILKMRLYKEISNKSLNALCIYCGQPISQSDAIRGVEVDIEHIIPKAKLFDDSQSNKTLAHRKCNKGKGDSTAYDFMKTKSPEDFSAYLERVSMLYSNKIIGRAKRDKLLMTESKIPNDFIDRQLRESQYIARKAREMLQTVSHTVWTTSGSVTAELRALWGWNDVTMNLQFNKYKELEQTSFVEWESEHGKNKHRKEVITGWNKRDDHRHHAIDALVIACTKQGYIQRFNTLNSSKTRDDLKADVDNSSVEFKEKLSLLEKYIVNERPFTVREVEEKVAEILVSFKAGKKAAVLGKRKIGKKGSKRVVQTGIVIPRGPLSEESVYGRIKITEEKPTKYAFENPELVAVPEIKVLIEERIAEHGDAQKAYASLKKKPLHADKNHQIPLKSILCFTNSYVIKYPVDVNFDKLEKVVDKGIKRKLVARLRKFGLAEGEEKDGKKVKAAAKEAFRDVQRDGRTLKWYEDEGLSTPIKSVRCNTGLSAVEPIRKDENGNATGYVKPGNNHHIAIYTNAEGGKEEYLCTFWHAVERKRYGLPLIIENTNEIWDKIQQSPQGTFPEEFLEKLPKPNLRLELSMQQNEMFILGMPPDEVSRCMDSADYKTISDKLYRVQKLSNLHYVFRHHLETQLADSAESMKAKRFIRVVSLKSLFSYSPCKVKIDCTGALSISGK